MMKTMMSTFFVVILCSCTSNRLDDIEKRLATLEEKERKVSMAITQVTDKVFDGKSVTIEGVTYFPEPKIFENEDYKVYYRKKEGDLFLDVVLVSKKLGMTIVGADSAKLDGKRMVTQGGAAIFEHK